MGARVAERVETRLEGSRGARQHATRAAAANEKGHTSGSEFILPQETPRL